MAEEILYEMQEGEHDLLVMGAPLADREGRVVLDGVIGPVLHSAPDYPILIVRSFVETRYEPVLVAPNGRATMLKETIS